MHSVFIWSQPHHAPVLAASVSALFLLIWILNTSILTTISVIGIILTIADYTVPLLSTSLIDSSKFGPAEETVYENVCSEIALTWFTLQSFWNQWTDLKEKRPVVHSFLLLTSLLMMAYIGNSVDNLFLLYLITLLTVLFPGLRHQGIIQKLSKKAFDTIRDTIGARLKPKQQ